MRAIFTIIILFTTWNLFAANKGLGFKFAQGQGVLHQVEKIKEMKILSNVHVPKAIFLPLMGEGDNIDFAAKLYQIIASINDDEGLIEDSNAYYQSIDFIALGDSSRLNYLQSQLDDTRYLKTVKSDYILSDRWFQDWGEFVATGVDKKGKTTYGIYYVNRGRGLEEIVKELSRMLDIPFIRSASKSGSGGDNGGNLEAAPDGTIIVGDTMYDAQIEQLRKTSHNAPIAILMTDWLAVGHVDETLSVIPSKHQCFYPTDFRGDAANYSIVTSDPILGLEVILNYKGKQRKIVGDYNQTSKKRYYISDLKRAIKFFLKNKKTHDLSYNDFVARDFYDVVEKEKGKNECYRSQLETKYCHLVEYNVALARDILSFNKELLEYETPCLNDDFISIPELYHLEENDGWKYGIALLPGMANLVVLRDHLIIPDPTFDGFKESVLSILAPEVGGEEKIHFIMDKYEYHDLMGEVHCGTNVFRDAELLIEIE